MKKYLYNLLIILFFLSFVFISCDDDDKDPVGSETAEYDLLLSTTLGQTSFISLIPGLTQENVDNSNAVETTFFAYPFVYKNWLFTLPNQSADIVNKYDIGDDGSLRQSGSFVGDQASFPSDIAFVSDTKAYVTFTFGGKIVVINPTTMERISTIDLIGSEFAVGDNNPDPSNMIIRDGKLFVALAQSPDGQTGLSGVHLLIIDIATDTIEKYIVDNREGALCGRWGEQQMFFMDESENIYVYFAGSWGFVPGQKSGYLRINKGETDFDPNYILYFNDLSIAGVDGIDYCNTVQYAGNNQLFGIANVPSLASNPPDYVNDRTGIVIKVDLVTKTAERIDFPDSKLISHLTLYDNKILAALSTTTGLGIYTYDLATGTTSDSPVVNIQGDPLFLVAL